VILDGHTPVVSYDVNGPSLYDPRGENPVTGKMDIGLIDSSSIHEQLSVPEFKEFAF